jgi:hypothetical protein
MHDSDMRMVYESNRHSFSNQEDEIVKQAISDGFPSVRIHDRHPLEVARRVKELTKLI